VKTCAHFSLAFLIKTVSCEVRTEAEEIDDDLEICKCDCVLCDVHAEAE